MISINNIDSNANQFNGTSTSSFYNKLEITMMRKQASTVTSTPDGWKFLYSLVEELWQDNDALVGATAAYIDYLAERKTLRECGMQA